MTRTAHILAQVAAALILLSLFTPIPGLMYVVVALLLTALVLLVASTGVFKRREREPVAAPPSPQQVMRNTRAELPNEYREWFDWTADIAGFDLSRPWIVGDSPAADEAYSEWIKKQANRGIAIGRECRRASPVLIDHSVTKVRLYAQPKNPQIEIKDGQVVDNPDGGIRPHGICSYGPGVGWEEDWIDGHHVWIRRQA